MNFLEVVKKAFNEDKSFKRKGWYVSVRWSKSEVDPILVFTNNKSYSIGLDDVLASDWELIEPIKTEKQLLEDLNKKVKELENYIKTIHQNNHINTTTPYVPLPPYVATCTYKEES